MSAHSSSLKPLENAFARMLGIQISYVNNDGVEIFLEREIFDKVAREVLPKALPFEGEWNEAFLEKLLRHNHKRLVPENTVVWGKNELVITSRRLSTETFDSLVGDVVLEDGARKNFKVSGIQWKHIPSHASPFVSLQLVEARIATDLKLPLGYHTLKISNGEKSQIICAPQSLPSSKEKTWGAFVPTYALRSKSDWGSGSYTELGKVSSWLASLGAKTVATLPLLPSFLEDWKSDPSPYSPASRLFWNEFYVDPTLSPEWKATREAQKLYAAAQPRIKKWRAAKNVPYFEIAQLKRAIIEAMARKYFESGDKKRLAKALAAKPKLVDYAGFRAHSFATKTSWWGWNDAEKRGLDDSKMSKNLVEYYIYAQMLAMEQMQELADAGHKKNMSFYLDLPVGVHSDSYDVWKNSEQYCLKLSAGAPPDPFFTKGQNWGFPPFRPCALSEDRLVHFREILRHHLSHASLLRLDHVMGFHRIYVVPHHIEADRGAYIRFPFEELYAVLLLEGSRAGARLVGEDLGTVPEEVRASLDGHGLSRLFVFQYEAHPSKDGVVTPAASNTVATLNTHDMPMWAAYWDSLDLPDRLDLGLLNKKSLAVEASTREKIRQGWLKVLGRTQGLKPKSKPQEIFEATMFSLAASDAELALITLEDMWLEKRPQNTPGTYMERKNWQRKCTRTLEELKNDTKLLRFMRQISKLRNASRA